MDNRAIGVFDSGLGGLTCVRRIKELMPGEDIIYLGDTGRQPYGTRSREVVLRYAREDAEYLITQGVKVIVIACGTASATALTELRGAYKVPVYGVVEASSRKATEVTRSGRIGVIGTGATIRSGVYERAIRMYGSGYEVHTGACPLLVSLVENGRISGRDMVVRTVVGEYLEPIKAAGVDTLVLACTHFPILEGVIKEIMGRGVELVDSGGELAESLSKELKSQGLESSRKKGGEQRYCVTDETEGFIEIASMFLKEDVGGKVRKVDVG